ncbi:MAG: histidinol dehydrogenase, partial [Nanoarchaeota archaeon]|nr:histidinol dehydrogenase [Nanoarchaeota archaeon]
MEKEKIAETVRGIISRVRCEGDEAIRNISSDYGENITYLEVSKEEIKEAYGLVDKELLSALRIAASNIKEFAELQMDQVKPFEQKKEGIIVGQRIAPIDKAGCYVPGGRYPLLSSALMGIIPAKVAGVKEVIVCSPKIQPAIIAAADIAGADRIFRIGGAQAIAAMAYGTETIPKVDKIVGPGNVYVTEAKRQVYGDVGIDFIAGPSEILIIADNDADPKIIAADMLAQAEHDVNAVPLCLATSDIAPRIQNEIDIQLSKLS